MLYLFFWKALHKACRRQELGDDDDKV